MPYRFAISTAILAFIGCAGPSSPSASTELLSVRVNGETFTLTTQSAEPVYYMVANPDALILLALCRTPSCPHVTAGHPVILPLTSIAGYFAGGHTGMAYYWHLMTSIEGDQPDSVRTLRFSY